LEVELHFVADHRRLQEGRGPQDILFILKNIFLKFLKLIFIFLWNIIFHIKNNKIKNQNIMKNNKIYSNIFLFSSILSLSHIVFIYYSCIFFLFFLSLALSSHSFSSKIKKCYSLPSLNRKILVWYLVFIFILWVFCIFIFLLI